MRCGPLAFALAACGSSSPSGARPDANGPDAAASCEVSGVVNGSWITFTGTNMFAAVVAVETWDTDTTGSVVRHMTIADETWKLHIDGASMATTSLEPLFEGDGEVQPAGTGMFTRANEPCAEGTFEAVFDNGVLSGMYRGPYLGLNPPGP